MHSENLWFSWSKTSNYREKLRCHTRDGRTDEQTNGRTENVENRAVFWWTRNRKKEIGSQEICMPGILMPSPFPALQMKNCHYFLALPLAVSFGSICFDCWLKAHWPRSAANRAICISMKSTQFISAHGSSQPSNLSHLAWTTKTNTSKNANTNTNTKKIQIRTKIKPVFKMFSPVVHTSIVPKLPT